MYSYPCCVNTADWNRNRFANYEFILICIGHGHIGQRKPSSVDVGPGYHDDTIHWSIAWEGRNCECLYEPTVMIRNMQAIEWPTCDSSCIYDRDARLTLSNNIPSLRHCHHSQLIGGARKETSHTEECLIWNRVRYNLITLRTAIQITCSEQIVWDRWIRLDWSFPADLKQCCLTLFDWNHVWLTRRSFKNN